MPGRPRGTSGSWGIGLLKCATLDELALVLDTAERVHPEGEIEGEGEAMLAYPLSKTVLRGVIAHRP
ncbi:MAG: hypothetical protein JKY37_07445 [Nannocystaceae bacterium]|nr:hypothetical protein [Nannocystaceae bacterium]